MGRKKNIFDFDSPTAALPENRDDINNQAPGYITFFMLNSIKDEILLLKKLKIKW